MERKAMLDGIAVLHLLLMLFLSIFVIVVVVLACRQWRLLFRPSSRNRRFIPDGDLEIPLVSKKSNSVQNHSSDSESHAIFVGSSNQIDGHFSPPRAHGLVHKHRLSCAPPHSAQGESLVLDVISEPSEEVIVGQTVKRLSQNYSPDEKKDDKAEDSNRDLKRSFKNGKLKKLSPKDFTNQRSCLTLEAISGPSRGDRCSMQSTCTSRFPLYLGRVSSNDLVVKDPEVSGKHALITWNSNKLKWELMDIGSLNGTLLNSHAIHHPDSGTRYRGDSIELADGDIITLGTSSKIYVQISSETEGQIPFRFGIAADPMALRLRGKRLPMEDVCFHQWPLHGVDQFGLFGICDGHGGAQAAKSASRILPEMVSTILSDSQRREKVLLQFDASDVLRDAFFQTEACLDHHYEGCTATVLLVWVDGQKNLFAQCANVGDSACVFDINGKQIRMTEDHRISSHSERIRINETGEPLKHGEQRLCGINLGRMLGDKFLKQQDSRFSSEPYISQAVHIDQASGAFALLASDGFWDVVSFKKAVQLVLQMKEICGAHDEGTAEKIANFLLSEARTLRTKDNTSILFIEFGTPTGISSCIFDA